MGDVFNRIEEGLREIFPEIGDMKITPDTLLGEIPDWDSMSAVNFQAYIERNFKIPVPQDLLNEDMTIREVISFIQEPGKMQAVS